MREIGGRKWEEWETWMRENISEKVLWESIKNKVRQGRMWEEKVGLDTGRDSEIRWNELRDNWRVKVKWGRK